MILFTGKMISKRIVFPLPITASPCANLTEAREKVGPERVQRPQPHTVVLGAGIPQGPKVLRYRSTIAKLYRNQMLLFQWKSTTQKGGFLF